MLCGNFCLQEFLQIVCETLMYECMYHWGVLPRSVAQADLDGPVMTCLKKVEGNKDLDSLSKFLQGVILKQKNHFQEAQGIDKSHLLFHANKSEFLTTLFQCPFPFF